MGSRLGFTRNLRRSQMKPIWKHDEIFPIIAHIIERQYRGDGRYMPSRQINAFSFCFVSPEHVLGLRTSIRQKRDVCAI